MSANNQILVKEHDGRFYVFDNVNAESWSKKNELRIKEAIAHFSTLGKAFDFASEHYSKLEWPEQREYGIIPETLAKDGAEVTIIP